MEMNKKKTHEHLVKVCTRISLIYSFRTEFQKLQSMILSSITPSETVEFIERLGSLEEKFQKIIESFDES